MKAVIIETNVIAVANEMADHADSKCIVSCINSLEKTKMKQKIVIDSGMLIFEEYFRYAHRSGQPRVGDAFLKWLWDNQANSKRCERVNITPRDIDPDNFKEFPDDPALNKFDRSDRKFVAIACASNHHPKILNATDSDWYHFKTQLSNYGVFIKFLCPNLMKPKNR